jgi:hypothetical protein
MKSDNGLHNHIISYFGVWKNAHISHSVDNKNLHARIQIKSNTLTRRGRKSITRLSEYAELH